MWIYEDDDSWENADLLEDESQTKQDSTSLKEATNMNTVNAIQVKIGKLGERTEEFTLAEGSTVQDLVSASGKETAGYQFRINGEVATVTQEVEDGDIVQLLPAVKGGR